MSTLWNIAVSSGICLIAALLEGIFAGSGIKQRLAELRTPRYAPPLWGWVLVAIAYYVICFSVLFCLFAAPATRSRNGALGLIAITMFLNALWNYFFFRTRNLFHAFLVGLLYGGLICVLFFALLEVNRIAAWWLLPYVLYLPYATGLGHGIWRMNQPDRPSGS